MSFDDKLCPRHGKISYTRGGASLAADSIRRQVNRRGRRSPMVTTYKCPDCGDWHLTSKKKSG